MALEDRPIRQGDAFQFGNFKIFGIAVMRANSPGLIFIRLQNGDYAYASESDVRRGRADLERD